MIRILSALTRFKSKIQNKFSSDDLFAEEGGGFGPGFTKDFFESTHLDKGNEDMTPMQ